MKLKDLKTKDGKALLNWEDDTLVHLPIDKIKCATHNDTLKKIGNIDLSEAFEVWAKERNYVKQ